MSDRMRASASKIGRLFGHLVGVLTIRSRRDERGSIIVISALVLPMAFAATSLAFDIGQLVDTNRSTQALADAVALDGANFLNGTAASTVYDTAANLGGPFALGLSPTGLPFYLDQVVQYEATESAMRNGVDLTSPTAASDSLVLGSCAPGANGPCDTFTSIESCPLTVSLPEPGAASGCIPEPGADPTTVINAVRMDAAGITGFAFHVGSITSNRSAIAMTVQSPPALCTSAASLCPYVGVSNFSIGSGLVEERTSGIGTPTLPRRIARDYLVKLLTKQLQASSTNISALDFNGLANANVTLGDLLAANSNVGSFSQLLDATITPAQALSRYYRALLYKHFAPEVNAGTQFSQDLGVTVNDVAANVGSSGGLQMCQLVGVTKKGSITTNACALPDDQKPLLANAQIDALDYLVGVASLINGQNAVAVDLEGNVPTDVGNLTASVTVTAISPVAESNGTGPASADGQSDDCPQNSYVDQSNSYICAVTATDTQAQVSISIPNLPGGVTLNLQAVGAQATGALTSLVCGSTPPGSTVPNPDVLTITGTSTPASITPTFIVPSIPISTTVPTLPVPLPTTSTTIVPLPSTTLPATTVPTIPPILGSTTTTLPVPVPTTATTTTIPLPVTTTVPTSTPSQPLTLLPVTIPLPPSSAINDTFTGPFVKGSSPAPEFSGTPLTIPNNVTLPTIPLQLPVSLSSIPGLSDALNYINSQLPMLLDSASVDLGYATVTDQSDDCSVAILVG